jgi:hypothetical protein
MNWASQPIRKPNRMIPKMSTKATYRSHYIQHRNRQETGPRLRNGDTMIKGLLALLIFFLVATFPATWLLMLFLGNVGLGLSYWGTLPLGILVSVLLGSASAPTFVVRG